MCAKSLLFFEKTKILVVSEKEKNCQEHVCPVWLCVNQLRLGTNTIWKLWISDHHAVAGKAFAVKNNCILGWKKSYPCWKKWKNARFGRCGIYRTPFRGQEFNGPYLWAQPNGIHLGWTDSYFSGWFTIQIIPSPLLFLVRSNVKYPRSTLLLSAALFISAAVRGAHFGRTSRFSPNDSDTFGRTTGFRSLGYEVIRWYRPLFTSWGFP